ncbi:hypothetical protein BDV09DRAFT_198232 [Aspergillus tetrazonus]
MDLYFRHTEGSTEAFIWTNAGTSPTIKEMELKEREFNNFTLSATLNYGALSAPHATSTFTVPKPGCYIQANITLPENTQHSIGLILPDELNGRFMAVGNGEFSGSIGWSDIIDASWSGFAAVSSDLGHEGNNGSFGYHNEAALQNW